VVRPSFNARDVGQRVSTPNVLAARSGLRALAFLGFGAASVLVGFMACNVQEQGADTGGLGGSLGQGGASPCPRGLAVVLSDYASTQVALVDPSGQTESESLISTASSRTDGLAFALSGDVVLPSTRPESGLVVLLDRFGTNVMTFIDPYSGRVLHQLPVGTGFESNPHDYLEFQGRGYVARFGHNTDPGREPFDGGGDLLVLDLDPPQIAGRLEIPSSSGLPSRPTALSPVGEEIIVTIARIALDFRTTGAAALVVVAPTEERVIETLDLEPYKNCSRATLSPNRQVLAVVCSGALDQDGEVADLGGSGILLLSATERPLELVDELPADELGEGALQPDVAFFSDDILLVKTQTELDSAEDNRLLAVDLVTRSATTLLEARPGDSGQGQGIVYGGLICPDDCAGVCLLADADRRVLQRIGVDADGRPELLTPSAVEERIGLPPIALSPF